MALWELPRPHTATHQAPGPGRTKVQPRKIAIEVVQQQVSVMTCIERRECEAIALACQAHLARQQQLPEDATELGSPLKSDNPGSDQAAPPVGQPARLEDEDQLPKVTTSLENTATLKFTRPPENTAPSKSILPPEDTPPPKVTAPATARVSARGVRPWETPVSRTEPGPRGTGDRLPTPVRANPHPPAKHSRFRAVRHGRRRG